MTTTLTYLDNVRCRNVESYSNINHQHLLGIATFYMPVLLASVVIFFHHVIDENEKYNRVQKISEETAKNDAIRVAATTKVRLF